MNYELFLTLLGGLTLAAAILPHFLRKLPLSLPMVLVAAGLVLPVFLPKFPQLDVISMGVFIEKLTEFAVIMSLTGAGLKIDRRIGWREWGTTWRLLALTMPLSIAMVALGGLWLAGLPLAAALLLGAAIAPTDPVLAASVQVGKPREGNEPETRFALTSEAGLNDGLAFPFVYFAIFLAQDGFSQAMLLEWLSVSVLWKIACGVGMGLLVGAVMARLVFLLVDPGRGAQGFVALSLTLSAYGLCELAQGYGFLAVFVAALTFRDFEREHDYHVTLHDFGEEIEMIFLALLLLMLGVAVAQGLLAHLSPELVILAVLVITVIRPLAGWIGLIGSDLPHRQRVAISVLGIRGIGTFYYLSYALNNAPFEIELGRELWAVSGLIVLISVVLHGIWAPGIIQMADRDHEIK
ncbi:NhaP-type Na+/H+ or K+/H+ antiporter [Paracoccus isoporae]|uniref:NhaP-type Na+/H+ or K+/H+ antiporter n=1 Tax=Paracoccus isoporae TaxID=591205 RepID=A0A1G7AV15_9RHOB|nr:cation:proton antiporter [Paracoccus isoporae]SDE17776.1 NhaP-type Na+/H+ or K+/H+ antiporter [Paracoccus isoporae]